MQRKREGEDSYESSINDETIFKNFGHQIIIKIEITSSISIIKNHLGGNGSERLLKTKILRKLSSFASSESSAPKSVGREKLYDEE